MRSPGLSVRSSLSFLILAAATALAPMHAPANAQQAVSPGPGPGDPRIRQVMYDENQIVTVKARMGYEMVIEFDPAERIENVSIGDSLSWQVTPNRKATLLFIKPMAKTAPTSMTVATNRRLYSFLLTTYESRGANDPEATFRLRFLYPEPPAPPVEAPPPAPPPPDPASFNFSYAWKGAKALYPIRVFDDGKVTYFEFTPENDQPAVFVLGSDGQEEMAATRIEGRYAVADFIAKTFVLRYGKAKITVSNNAYREPARSTVSTPPAVLPRPGG